MTKRVVIWIAVTLPCIYIFIVLAVICEKRRQATDDVHWHYAANGCGIMAIVSFIAMMAGSVGALLLGSLRSSWLGRHGTPMQGRVIHARPAGFTFYRANWEIELQLTDGRMARMQMVRGAGFRPGETMTVMVGRGNPAHATLPAEATTRQGF